MIEDFQGFYNFFYYKRWNVKPKYFSEKVNIGYSDLNDIEKRFVSFINKCASVY